MDNNYATNKRIIRIMLLNIYTLLPPGHHTRPINIDLTTEKAPSAFIPDTKIQVLTIQALSTGSSTPFVLETELEDNINQSTGILHWKNASNKILNPNAVLKWLARD
jgi:hypothetical protein